MFTIDDAEDVIVCYFPQIVLESGFEFEEFQALIRYTSALSHLGMSKLARIAFFHENIRDLQHIPTANSFKIR